MFGIVANIVVGLMRTLYGLTTAVVSGTNTATIVGPFQIQHTDGVTKFRWNPGTPEFLLDNSAFVEWRGTSLSARSAGLKRIADNVVGVYGAAGTTDPGWMQSPAGRARVTTQFDKVNATLANVTGLSVTLIAGRTYKFIASLPVTADAVGGYKVAMAGTVTATAVYYDVVVEANGIAPSLTRLAALAGTASGTLGTTVRIWIEGVITVNAAGTLTVQFAQSAANGTSSVLVGADLMVEDMP